MKRSGPLRRRKALQANKQLRRGKPLNRGRWASTELELNEATLRAIWKATVLAVRQCAVCGVQPHLYRGSGPTCTACGGKRQAPAHTRWLEAHHCLPKRIIRKVCKALQCKAGKWLWDVRNGLCLCNHCHARHESAKAPVPRAVLPASAWEFAEDFRDERGNDHTGYLLRHYPEAAAA